MTAPRLRFAPSPTGSLHIGGVRTALFNWLWARKHRGQFLLRIEDTDLERSEDRFTQDILGAMKWLGLNWDEEPLYQSKRMEIYRKAVDQMVEHGHAYWCTCTEADVEKMREKQMAEGKKPMYDRRCSELKRPAPKSGEMAVARLKIPQNGQSVEFKDLIRGSISVANEEIDDFVLIRSNGAPTYNLSVVIDDAESRVSHIVRGDDHINNTPKQIHLYRYLGLTPPHFAHLPMILGADKKKLSKRNAVTAVSAYRAEGYLPETMLNFLARLGWSHGDQEVFTVQEMIEFFDFDHVQKSGAVWNPEKLLWLNGEHIRRADSSRLAGIVAEDYADLFKAAGARLDRVSTPTGAKLCKLIQPKVKLMKEMADQLVPLCMTEPVEVDASGLKWNKDASVKAAVKNAVLHLHADWQKRVDAATKSPRAGADSAWGASPSLGDLGLTHTDIEAFVKQTAEQHGVKAGDFISPMRLCVSGRAASASFFELVETLPWEVVGPRLEKVQTL